MNEAAVDRMKSRTQWVAESARRRYKYSVNDVKQFRWQRAAWLAAAAAPADVIA